MALRTMVLLRKLQVLKGTLVVQSLGVDVDSGFSRVLSGYWVGDGIFAVIWPFLGGCWLHILGCRGFRLWHIDVSAGTGNAWSILWIASKWIRSWVRYPLGWWSRSGSGHRGNADALQEIRSWVVLLDGYIGSVMGLRFSG